MQKLLDDTDYKGNTSPVTLTNQPGLELPALDVFLSDYLNAYGVMRYETKRGRSEFSPGGRKVALEALTKLATRKHLMHYTRKSYGKKKCAKEIIQHISPLLLRADRIDRILKIVPAPVLVDQIGTYFLWKPVDLFEHDLDGKDCAKMRFIEYLFYRHEQDRRQRYQSADRFVIGIQPDVLAYRLHLDFMFASRQSGKLRKKLTSYYEDAVKLGYLTRFEVDQPGTKVDRLDILQLNPGKFEEMRLAV